VALELGIGRAGRHIAEAREQDAGGKEASDDIEIAADAMWINPEPTS
jgi:hypothetical protein